MSDKRKKYLKFTFARRRTKLIAISLVKLEKRFDSELNNIVLPCGTKIRLASSISRYEKMRLMMETEGFRDDIPVKDYEYAARIIDAWLKQKRKDRKPGIVGTSSTSVEKIEKIEKIETV
jgi:hypothetical protein